MSNAQPDVQTKFPLGQLTMTQGVAIKMEGEDAIHQIEVAVDR